MATIYSDSFHGGAGHTDGDEVPLALAFQDTADDLAELREKLISTLTQLDTEGGLGGGYVAGNTPDAMKTVNGGER